MVRGVPGRCLAVSSLLAVLLLVVPLTAACDYVDTEVAGESRVKAPLVLTGRVVDAANVLPPADEDNLERLSKDLEKDTLVQFVIVSTPSLDGKPIKEYSMALGNGWGVGDADRNDGVLLIVAPKEGKVRIEVGIGLEDELPDELCTKIIEHMLPHLREGNIPKGMMTGARQLDRILREKST